MGVIATHQQWPLTRGRGWTPSPTSRDPGDQSKITCLNIATKDSQRDADRSGGSQAGDGGTEGRIYRWWTGSENITVVLGGVACTNHKPDCCKCLYDCISEGGSLVVVTTG